MMHELNNISDLNSKTVILDFNPFPGLRPFGIEESHLFFGREEQCDDVLNHLANNRFIAITGPSGSGKSSFVRCGVLPILFGGFVTDYGSNWEIIQTRPGISPLKNLAASIVEERKEYQEAEKEEKLVQETITKTMLESGSLGLAEALMQQKTRENTNFLIIIDQFEELFRFKNSDDEEVQYTQEANDYINLLYEAIHFNDLPIFIIFTMRSDYIGECGQFPLLTSLVNRSHYLLPQMTRDQKRRAIVGPVSVGGGTISSILVQQLLNDLGNNPDQLPILQHALMRTWNYSKGNGDVFLDIDDYQAIGGMSEALSQHANEAYDELNDKQKNICESIFKSLTEKGQDNTGLRRPTSVCELAAIAGEDEESVIEIIEKFRQPGRSLIMPAANVPLSSDTIIDISHESLMRIWTRLKRWVEEESESAHMYQRLADAAAMHQIGKTSLWRPPDLQMAVNWQQKQEPTLVWGQRYHPAYERTMVFLRQSSNQHATEQKAKTEAQKRTLRQAKVVAIILGLATIISIGFLVFALQQKVEADSQRQEADIQRHEADRQKELALNSAEEADNRKKEAERARLNAEEKRQEAELTREEAERARRDAEEKAIEAELAREEADRQRKRAEEERYLAEQAQKVAQEQRKIADSRKGAEENEKQAKKLRFLSIAKSIAVKSLQVTTPNKKALLAKQAYIFNTLYEGNPFNSDVFEGLYQAVKLVHPELFKSEFVHEGSVRSMVSGKNNNIVYSAGNDGKIIEWNTERSIMSQTNIAKNNFKAWVLAVSNNDQFLAAGGDETYIQIYDLNSPGKKPQKIENLKESIRFLTFTHDDGSLIFADISNKIYKWNFKELTRLSDSRYKIDALASNPVADQIAYGDRNGRIIFLNSLGEDSLFFNSSKAIYSLAFSRDGNLLAAGDEEGIVRIWDLSQNQLVATLKAHNARVNDLKFSPDDHLLASASFDKTVQVWDLHNLDEQPVVFKDNEDWAWSLAFSPDGKKILAGSRNNAVRVWPVELSILSNMVCESVTRNLTLDEWNQYAGSDIPYQATCYNLPSDKKAIDSVQPNNLSITQEILITPIKPNFPPQQDLKKALPGIIRMIRLN